MSKIFTLQLENFGFSDAGAALLKKFLLGPLRCPSSRRPLLHGACACSGSHEGICPGHIRGDKSRAGQYATCERICYFISLFISSCEQLPTSALISHVCHVVLLASRSFSPIPPLSLLVPAICIGVRRCIVCQTCRFDALDFLLLLRSFLHFPDQLLCSP